MYSVAADGSNENQEAASTEGHFHSWGWSADGGTIVAAQFSEGDVDIVRWQISDPEAVEPIVQSAAAEGLSAAISPDGRWIAYTSDESSQDEIYVRAYPGPGSERRISPNGGTEVMWSRGGDELYYLEGDRLMAVSVDGKGETFEFVSPTESFVSSYIRTNQPPSFDVDKDGRFIMIRGRRSLPYSCRHELAPGADAAGPRRLMPLAPGTTLGPYSVTAKIGEGGMGEAYRARDTNLDRDVALKVLPPAFTDDPDRLARFEEGPITTRIERVSSALGAVPRGLVGAIVIE